VTPTPADIRNAVLLSVATFAAGFITPVLPYLGLPLAAFALGWIAYRFGSASASILAVAACLPVALYGPSALGVSRGDAAFVAVALLAMGPGAAWALRRYPALLVAGGLALLITGAFLVSPIGAQTLEQTLAVWKQALETAASSGNVSDPASLRVSATAFLQLLSVSWPALSVYTVGAGAVLGVPLVGRAGRALGQHANVYPRLPDVDLSFHLVWPAIAGLGLMAAGTFWQQGKGPVYAAGLNILMVLRPIMLLQGLAVFAALYRKIGVGRVMRTIGFAMLGVTELLLPSVSVLGVVDLFANLRKLPRTGGASPGTRV
jgi:predicted membrane protein DUF2232